MPFRIIVLALVISLSAVAVMGKAVPHEVVLKSNKCLYTQPFNMIMRNQADFDRYQTLTKCRNLAKRVDWDNEMLLAVHIGSKPSASLEVLIEKIEENKGNLSVVYALKGPKGDPNSKADLSSPFIVIKTPKVNGFVYFTESAGGFQDFSATVLLNHSSSALQSFSTRVIKNQNDFDNYWKSLKLSSDKEKPKINWSKHEVAAIHLGERPTAGYAVKTTRLRLDSRLNLTVCYMEIKPKGNQAQVLTYPFEMILIPKPTAGVSFVKEIKQQ